MKQSARLGIILLCMLASGLTALYEAQTTRRSNQRTENSVPRMVTTTNAFLSSLTPEQLELATFEFNNKERLNWHFIPRERLGLPIKQMEPFQRELSSAMLVSGLSQTGFIKATTIMSLEQVLFELENEREMRDEELYFFSVFGNPSEKDPWGWRFEGHHLSLNFTIENGKISATTPAFFGANPAEVKTGRLKGLRPLGQEEDIARQLYNALDENQKITATIADEAPRDIVMNPDRNERLKDEGILLSDLNDSQRRIFGRLVREYTNNLPPGDALAAGREIRESSDQIYFSWAGSGNPGEGHYYRIQGSTFVIEYDNIQNTANHIHSVWRKLGGDFGVDLLAQHYRTSHNKAVE